MKRIHIATATAILVGSIPLPQDREDLKCEDPPCANKENATIPEPLHVPEKAPGYEAASDEVELMNHSPIITAKRGSKEHLEYLEWVKENRISFAGELWRWNLNN